MFGINEEIEPIAELAEVKVVCENCGDSGKACSVCHAGDQVE